MQQNGQPSPEAQREAMRQQEEMERRRSERQLASQLAGEAAMGQGAAPPGYWEIIGDPDIGREIGDENLEEFAATEFSNRFALGNFTYDDWKSLTWRIETEFWTMRNEFRDQDGDLDDADMAAMYGERKPKLTDERARRLRSAGEGKKMHASLGVDARGLRSGTEIHAVAKNERPEEESEEGGLLSKAKRRLV